MSLSIPLVPVSVVIPCFRCGLTIRRAMESVLSQTARPFEVILVEDFSQDGTLEVVLELEKQHPGFVKVVAMERNFGVACARNKGWAVATQPFVAFLDADDSWHAEKLHIQYAYMKTNTRVILCGHLCFELDGINLSPPLPKQWKEKSIHLTNLVFKNAFSTPTVMLVRDIPFRFQPDKRHAEDFLLWLQIASAGFQIARLELPLAYVHKPFFGKNGLSSELWKMERGELANFFTLYSTGAIGVLVCASAMIFSIFKFIIRITEVRWIDVKQSFIGMKKS